MRLRKGFLLTVIAIFVVGAGCKKENPPAPTSPTPLATEVPVEVTSGPSEGTTDREQITVLTQNAVGTLDPYLMLSVNPEDSIAAHIWDTLVWLNDDLEPEPRLAESWRVVNDLTWELQLRQDVTFHNAEPFDAQAVKFSLERSTELEGSLETFASDVTLQGVEIIDDYTVHILTAEPAVSLIHELATVEMLPPVYYAQTPLEDLARNPVGSGPYQLTSWDTDGRLVLEADTDYWQGTPAVRTLVFQAESDADERLSRLGDGTADLITDLTPDQAEAANTERTQLAAIESNRRLFVGLRFEEDTPLSDTRVRQALNYAVDVQALITEFHAGYGQRYGSWVNPPYANPDLAPWPHDPDKAQELLTQAGYPNGFEITMDTPVGRYYQDREIAEAIATQLAQTGVRVTVQPQDWSTYKRERLVPKQTAPLFLLSLTSQGDALEDVQNLVYGFPFNPTLWYNEEFERLVSEAQQTLNQTLRLNLLNEAQNIAYEEAPWIWLWRPYLFYGVRNDLDWWQPRVDGLIYLYAPPTTETTQ